MSGASRSVNWPARGTEAARSLKDREGRVASGAPILPRADRIRYEELAADVRRHYETTGAPDMKEAETRRAHLDKFFAQYGSQAVRVHTLEKKLGRIIPFLFLYLSGKRRAGPRRRDFRKVWKTACDLAGAPRAISSRLPPNGRAQCVQHGHAGARGHEGHRPPHARRVRPLPHREPGRLQDAARLAGTVSGTFAATSVDKTL
jgi:hypothetical protein